MHTQSKAESTRQKILTVAAEEIHLHGFQSCNTSTIVQKSGVSKGALYHHFANKKALGYAVVDEVFAPKLLDMWAPVFAADDPLEAMLSFFRELLTWIEIEAVSIGCPINNLAQEMSPVDEGFRLRISAVMQRWQDDLEAVLLRGQQLGHVKAGIDTRRTAIFLIASIEGGCGLAKNAQDVAVFASCVHGLMDYVALLKGDEIAQKRAQKVEKEDGHE